MKTINVLFIIVFVISAALQYNDPDPYLWIPVYLFGAVLCFLALKNKYNPKLYIFGLAAYITYAGILFFSDAGVWDWSSKHNSEDIFLSMKATKPWIEKTREFAGLIILISALIINMIWLSKKQKLSKSI